MDALWPPATATSLIATTAIATAVFLSVSGAALWPRRPRVLPSPLHTTLPRTPKAEVESLVYQPDQFPGARDVPTPYGSIRVYEFGPEDGPKVLFVHGISTSCVTLSPIAHGLVDRGCRVMLFDLFGRGFSDGVGDLPHDDRLYVSQMLLALASSPLPWTGTRQARLRVVGYSLGGGIAVHFANTFPDLVESLVLLAPAGLIRPESFGVVSRFFFSSGLVPERILAVLTRRRLQQPIASSRQPKQAADAAAVAEAVVSPAPIEAAVAEAADPPPGQIATPLERRVLEYVRWMVIHHAGFVPAFMSSIRYAPLTHQHDAWKLLSRRSKGSTAVLLAEGDEIIDVGDYTNDALPLMGGNSHVMWRILPGGHDFVMTHAKLILGNLDELWGTNA